MVAGRERRLGLHTQYIIVDWPSVRLAGQRSSWREEQAATAGGNGDARQNCSRAGLRVLEFAFQQRLSEYPVEGSTVGLSSVPEVAAKAPHYLISTEPDSGLAKPRVPSRTALVA